FARLADDPLCVRRGPSAGARQVGIVVLRVDIGKTGLECSPFVSTDASVKNFIAAGGGIETPSVVFADDRNWERPIRFADHWDGLLIALHVDLMLVVVGVGETACARPHLQPYRPTRQCPRRRDRAPSKYLSGRRSWPRSPKRQPQLRQS